MHEWKPERRYSVQELVDAFQLNLIESSSKKQKHKRNKQFVDESNEQIWTPCPTENVVISVLKTRNLYKSPLDENKHDITCPWVQEHTDAVDHGIASVLKVPVAYFYADSDELALWIKIFSLLKKTQRAEILKELCPT